MNSLTTRETTSITNERIKSTPLSITRINTHIEKSLLNNPTRGACDVIWTYLNDLSICINLVELCYNEQTGNDWCEKTFVPHIINLSYCIKLSHLELQQVNQYTIDNIDLTQCVHLNKLIIQTKHIGTPINISPVINKLNLTKCVNLTHFQYGGGTILKDCKIFLPDLSKCTKLKYFRCNNYDQVVNVINLKLFPDMIEFNGNILGDLNSRVIQLESQVSIKDEKETMRIKLLMQNFNRLESKIESEIRYLNIRDETHAIEQIKIEERFNKLEEENKELRKIIDELRPIKSKYM
jgi:hypothetical protein